MTEVLFEGADDSIYKPLDYKEIDKEFFDWLNDEVPEKFAFLFVGMWGKGGYGEDRKDIGKLIKVFYESFSNKKKQPALILKTSAATFSVMSRYELLNKINQIKKSFPDNIKIPNVYLLHGDLTDDEMNSLYNHPKIKSMVSFTHGEGFGRPLLEATMTGLPVIASNWSGQVDFLDIDNSILVGGSLKQVPKAAVWKNIILPESKWFVIDENQAYKTLNYAFENHSTLQKKAITLMNNNRKKFTLNKMADKLKKLLDSYVGRNNNQPSQVSLNLPKLKKTTENKSEIKLPKLKKV